MESVSTFQGAEITLTRMAPRKNRLSGDPDYFNTHTEFKPKGAEFNVALLPKCLEIVLPSGNKGRVKFSKEFCNHLGVHNVCMKPYNQCVCSAPRVFTGGRKRNFGAFFNALDRFNP